MGFSMQSPVDHREEVMTAVRIYSLKKETNVDLKKSMKMVGKDEAIFEYLL